MQKIIIIGANSSISAQTIQSFKENDCEVVVVEKNNVFEPEPIKYKSYNHGHTPFINDLTKKNKKTLPLPKSKYHK
jgi:hypothetical protein